MHTHQQSGSFLSTCTYHVPAIHALVAESFTLVVFVCVIIHPPSAFLLRSDETCIMSTIKLDHAPLLETAINFPERKRFITSHLTVSRPRNYGTIKILITTFTYPKHTVTLYWHKHHMYTEFETVSYTASLTVELWVLSISL